MGGRTLLLVVTVAIVAAATAAALVLRQVRAAPPRPPPGVLHVRITDGEGGPLIAGRIVLYEDGVPMRWGRVDMYGKRQANGCALADGALGTRDGILIWRGEAELAVGPDGCEPWPAIPFGRFTVRAWRGLEHEVWEGTVEVAPGVRTTLTIPLERAFTAPDTVVADMHVHAAGSNDSGVPLAHRVMAMLASGVEVVGLSDHFSAGDLDDTIAALGVEDRIGSIASNEVGNDYGHFGLYPVAVAADRPRGGSPAPEEQASWPPARVIAWARRERPDALVQVNHPRFRMYAFFDVAGWDGVAWPPRLSLDFDVIEVLAGHTVFVRPGDRRADQGVRDLYTLVGHGKLVTGLGNSDTHHLDGVRDGLARSYLLVDDPARRLDDDVALAAIRARRAVATTCPWLDVEVTPAAGGASAGPGQPVAAPDGEVIVDVEVHQARWCGADRLRILVGRGDGGHDVARTIAIPAGQRAFRVVERIPVPVGDTWIGVDAAGDRPLPMAMTGSYHRERGQDAVPIAVANPILVDRDGDGRVRFGLADLPIR